MKRSPLKSNPEKTRAFIERGRRSSAESLNGSASKPKPRPISSASPAQRRKVRLLTCAVCGSPKSTYRAIDPAHVISRAAGGCDHEDCVVPLCRTFDGGCHREYDDGKLDLLPFLNLAEQGHAASHLGLLGALRRVTNDRSVAG